MNALREIRIGLCGCMDVYDGALDGRQFRFNGQRFVLREVKLPNETFHTKALKATRCHFFIDRGSDHPLDTYLFLERIDLVLSSSGRSERLVGRLWSAMAKEDYVWHSNQWISLSAPLSASGILRMIRRRLLEMGLAERSAWIKRMSF